jgi:hypothetical protein
MKRLVIAILLRTEIETSTIKKSEVNTNCQYSQNNLLNGQNNEINEQEKRKAPS